MSLEEFAADRAARLVDFDDEIRGIVEQSLANYGSTGWYEPIAEGAGVLWTEIFERESPTGQPGDARETFLRELRESLAKTAEPDQPPTKGQVDRVVNWVGVYTVNSATYFAGRDKDGEYKTWLSMDDEAVRPAHRAVDGQTVPIMGTFDVGGSNLHFPGEPVGPPEVWINCRCLLAVTGGPEMGTKITSFAAKAEEDEDLDGVEDAEDRELTDEELTSGELVDDVGEVPWHGVLVVEGTPTGDKRQFDEGALTYADFPLPITYQRASAEGHAGSVVVGRIDEIWKEGKEHRARGMFNTNVPEANEVIDGIVFGMLGGVSVDVDSSEFYLEYEETGDDEGVEEAEGDILSLFFGGDVKLTHFTAGRIRSASIVSIPAFAEAYVALGPDFDEETRDPEAGAGDADGEGDAGTEDEYEVLEEIEMSAEMEAAFQALLDALDKGEMGLVDEAYAITAAAFAPGTKDGPGWLTHPRATQRIRTYWTRGKGAAKIRWGVPGDFNRCRRQLAKYVNPAFLAGTCANMHKEAIGVWPGRERGDKHSLETAPAFNLVASAATMAREDIAFFANPKLERITPLTVDEDGWVYGHLAVWGTCHIGIDGVCTMPPVSETQYAFFATGQVLTTDGFVNTGRITLGTGHAGLRETLGDARRHYDDTGRAVADIAVYEDAIGIAFAGRVREGASTADVKALRASALSGDWRRTNRGGLELIGVLAVNAGGYPTPRFAFDGDQQVSLIASAGAVAPAREPKSVTAGAYFDSVDDLLALGRIVADELEYRQERKARLSTIRDPELLEAASARRAERLAAARSLEE